MLGWQPHAHETNVSKIVNVERFKKKKREGFPCGATFLHCRTLFLPTKLRLNLENLPGHVIAPLWLPLPSRTTSTASINPYRKEGSCSSSYCMAHPCSSPLRHTSYHQRATTTFLFCTMMMHSLLQTLLTHASHSQRVVVDKLLPKETPSRSRPSVCSPSACSPPRPRSSSWWLAPSTPG